MSAIHFTSFPQTEPPPPFSSKLADVFLRHEEKIGTYGLDKGLTSNEVLADIKNDLMQMGFEVEAGNKKRDKIERPVFFGENGVPTLQYEIDAYHPEWRCGLEVEAGRALMGNAIYRDLVQGLVMVQVDVLALAVPNAYKFKSGERDVISSDYEKTISVARTLYGHTRVRLPYSLIVIGY
jgi:hypothetical protein